MQPEKQQTLKKEFKETLTGTMQMYLDTCARCGLCVDKCHVFASIPEFQNSPVYRAELIRKLYRKYFKTEGKLMPFLGEVDELSDTGLDRLYEAAYSCTGCRRCMLYCPFGIDTQLIMTIAKRLLIEAGKEPQMLSMLANMSISKGTTIENTKGNFAKAMKNIEKEVLERWQEEAGEDVIPLEVQDANVLYVALAGKHSIIPTASILNAAKENWTLSYFEAVNFGAFLGNPQKTKEISERIINEAKALNVKEVAICECGTAFRVMKHLMGDLPFKVVTIVELIERYLKEGRIKVDKSKLEGLVTYHDPCQIARNAGVYEAPRYVISQLTDNFQEMTPTREDNWCCGGGGGLVAVRDKEYRGKTTKIKAHQIKALNPATLLTACENCHTALSDLNDYHKLGTDVRFITDIVSLALVK